MAWIRSLFVCAVLALVVVRAQTFDYGLSDDNAKDTNITLVSLDCTVPYASS